jgi:hypothetical protein
MDIFGVILLVILLSLLGGAGYFAYDYVQHKDDVTTKLKDTKTAIEDTKSNVEKEGDTRMSNLKYMVGEINKVHDDIYTTLDERVEEQKKSVEGVAANQNKLVTGMGTLFKIEDSQLAGATTNTMSILDLVESSDVNIELLNFKSIDDLFKILN